LSRYEILKKRCFQFSQKSSVLHFTSLSAILQAMLLSNVSFVGAKKTGKDATLLMSRT